MPRASDITDAQVEREQRVDPDLSHEQAVEQRLEHLEQARQGIADQQHLLGRVGAPLEPAEQVIIAEAAADVMKPKLPLEEEVDLTALLGAMLVKHGITRPEQVTGLVEAMKTRGATPFRPGEDDTPIQLTPEQEMQRAAEIAAKAQMRMTQLAISSDKQRNVLSHLQVPRSMFVPLEVHEQTELTPNGVRIRLGKGRHMVPPYVLEFYDYVQSKKDEESKRILFETRRVDITEEIYKQQRGIQQEVWTGYEYTIAKGA